MKAKRILTCILGVAILALPMAFAVEITDDMDINTDFILTSPAHTFSPEPGPNEPNWSSGSNSTHQFIAANAINILRNSLSSCPVTSYTTTIKTAADYPDSENSGQTDIVAGVATFAGHFYNPSTRLTWTDELYGRPKTDPTALDRLVWWYNESVRRYNNGNTSGAMTALGYTLHYAADLSTPHHAANRIVGASNHAEFEMAARVLQNSYIETSVSSSTFSWARSTTISDMGHNFAVNAKSWIVAADDLSQSEYAVANTLPKAQRNCAAVIYKFMVDTGMIS